MIYILGLHLALTKLDRQHKTLHHALCVLTIRPFIRDNRVVFAWPMTGTIAYYNGVIHIRPEIRTNVSQRH